MCVCARARVYVCVGVVCRGTAWCVRPWCATELSLACTGIRPCAPRFHDLVSELSGQKQIAFLFFFVLPFSALVGDWAGGWTSPRASGSLQTATRAPGLSCGYHVHFIFRSGFMRAPSKEGIFNGGLGMDAGGKSCQRSVHFVKTPSYSIDRTMTSMTSASMYNSCVHCHICYSFASPLLSTTFCRDLAVASRLSPPSVADSAKFGKIGTDHSKMERNLGARSVVGTLYTRLYWATLMSEWRNIYKCMKVGTTSFGAPLLRVQIPVEALPGASIKAGRRPCNTTGVQRWLVGTDSPCQEVTGRYVSGISTGRSSF